jgi:hypothetical protein
MTEPIKPDVDALLEDAEARLMAEHKAMMDGLAADGPSYGTLWATNHCTAPKPPKSCGLCQRGPQFYEGCSHCECPQRRVLSARLKEIQR